MLSKFLMLFFYSLLLLSSFTLFTINYLLIQFFSSQAGGQTASEFGRQNTRHATMSGGDENNNDTPRDVVIFLCRDHHDDTSLTPFVRVPETKVPNEILDCCARVKRNPNTGKFLCVDVSASVEEQRVVMAEQCNAEPRDIDRRKCDLILFWFFLKYHRVQDIPGVRFLREEQYPDDVSHFIICENYDNVVPIASGWRNNIIPIVVLANEHPDIAVTCMNGGQLVPLRHSVAFLMGTDAIEGKFRLILRTPRSKQFSHVLTDFWTVNSDVLNSGLSDPDVCEFMQGEESENVQLVLPESISSDASVLLCSMLKFDMELQ